MQKLSCQQIRDKWVEFFSKKCASVHKHIPSASLIPDNPTLLLNAAGMVPFVDIFTGMKQPPEPPRAVTVQKCVRVGGKDSDLENIGRTTRHHSFFEMLGNFSFGDYFKAEVIPWAWELVTKEYEMDSSKLYVTVFEGDEINDFDAEAYDIWAEVLKKDGLNPEERIIKMGRKDNFWGPPGATGPCGPCSEILFDRGGEDISKLPLAEQHKLIATEDDRFMEVWNLVFMQFEKDEEAKFTPLANKNIDTGAGLERFAMILQDVKNTFETDELRSIVDTVAADLGKTYSGKDTDEDIQLKIIADHLRCLTFLLSDGVRPSNLGRGYVLRMIVRRAARFVYLLSGSAEPKPFLFKHIAKVVELYSKAYPELAKDLAMLSELCQKEEEAFAKTIINGLGILEDAFTGKNKKALAADKQLSGAFAFDLYSTYGFPLELSSEIAEENGFTIDLEAYEVAKEKHSKASGSGAVAASVAVNSEIAKIAKEYGATKFLGYDQLESKAKVIAILPIDEEYSNIVLDSTTFYAESGGQVGDRGVIKFIDQEIQVLDTKKVEGVFLHKVSNLSLSQKSHIQGVRNEEEGSRLQSNDLTTNEQNAVDGALVTGSEVTITVDAGLRLYTEYHHSACHLLQSALRKVLGPEVQQAGSQVCEEYTRFDFNFDRGLKAEELKQAEDIINSWIKEGGEVETKVMGFDDAIAAGALAFFGDKYEDDVRVLLMGKADAKASVELCGGTHVKDISEIKQVKIATEGSVAAGIRRIKMHANTVAEDFIKEQEAAAKAAAEEEAAREAAKAAEKARKAQQAKLALEKVDQIMAKAEIGVEAKLLFADLRDFGLEVEADAVKAIAEAIRDKYKAAGDKFFLMLGSAAEGKVALVAAASDELVKDKKSAFNAGNAVREAAKLCGGGGGGRPNFAQAGAKDASKIAEALEQAKNALATVTVS